MVAADQGIGVILAGGESRRMGSDKALMLWKGRPLIAHVHDCLGSRFATVLVSAPAGRYQLPGLTAVEDRFPGSGPLAGISAALRTSGQPWAFIAACDMPLIVPEMIDAVLRAAEPGCITVATDGERLHPLFGLYPLSAADAIERRLMSGQPGVTAFVREMHASVADLSAWRDQLLNVNTAADLPPETPP